MELRTANRPCLNPALGFSGSTPSIFFVVRQAGYSQKFEIDLALFLKQRFEAVEAGFLGKSLIFIVFFEVLI